jgi:hypothetical protein
VAAVALLQALLAAVVKLLQPLSVAAVAPLLQPVSAGAPADAEARRPQFFRRIAVSSRS